MQINNGRIKDISGEIFGKWTVISLDHVENGKTYWLCKCECGKEKSVYKGSLKNGSSKSCGCYNPRQLPNGEASLNQLYNNYIQNSKKREIEFALNKEEFSVLTKQNCFYCGIKPEQFYKSRHNSGDYTYNGIDRLNSKEGYSIENTVPCCGRCNEAKNDLNYEDFVDWINRVHNNLNSMQYLRIKDKNGIIVPFIIQQ